MNINLNIGITNNSPIYNNSITGYFRYVTRNIALQYIYGYNEAGQVVSEETIEIVTYPIIFTPISFPSSSNNLTFNLSVSNVYSNIVFNFTFYNDLKLTQFQIEFIDSDSVVTYQDANGNTINNIYNAVLQQNLTAINGTITPEEVDGEFTPIRITLNLAPINIPNAITQTASQILTETVTKSAFNLVEAGLSLCQIESLKTNRLNEILNNIETLRNYSRDTGSTTTYNNNGSLNQAGSRYTENFPSAKFANSVGVNELLLNKKRYMFSNSLNKNVVSGPVAFNTLSGYSNTLPYNASSSGLTKVQQFANAARGRSLSGGPGRRYGVQFYDGRSLVSIPNIYNQTTQTNQTINICAFT